MAGIGVWAAYQPAAAWIKFWLLLTAILFFYHLSRQSADNLWVAAGILCLMGFGNGIFFFLSNNWVVQPQKFQLLSQIGMAWMRVRPDLGLEAMHPNDFAGIAALALPFSLALTLEFWRRKAILRTLLFGLMAFLTLATVLMSASRGAWMALAATAGLWMLWVMIGRLAHKLPLSHRLLYILTLGLLACLAVGYVWTAQHGRLSQIAVGEAGIPVADQRFHLLWSAFELIKDVPITGGGLDGFPGLYSSYIRINPNYITGYSHNIFFDASLEQGILGGLMLCWIYLGSILLLVLRPSLTGHSLLHKAILASLLIISFHGLVDDIVYDTLFTPLLFFVPGMAVGLTTYSSLVPGRISWDSSKIRRLAVPVFFALGLILIGLIAFRRPLLSTWYTDLGAVEMAKVELSDFPSGSWDKDQYADLLSPAVSLFNRALAYDPDNPRAHYRLGLIALLKRDFPAAVSHLEIAHRGDPYHRGMLKALGLSYIWNGQIEAALPLLSLIPESSQELAILSVVVAWV